MNRALCVKPELLPCRQLAIDVSVMESIAFVIRGRCLFGKGSEMGCFNSNNWLRTKMRLIVAVVNDARHFSRMSIAACGCLADAAQSTWAAAVKPLTGAAD